jgi:hypothetical protein
LVHAAAVDVASTFPHGESAREANHSVSNGARFGTTTGGDGTTPPVDAFDRPPAMNYVGAAARYELKLLFNDAVVPVAWHQLSSALYRRHLGTTINECDR